MKFDISSFCYKKTISNGDVSYPHDSLSTNEISYSFYSFQNVDKFLQRSLGNMNTTIEKEGFLDMPEIPNG